MPALAGACGAWGGAACPGSAGPGPDLSRTADEVWPWAGGGALGCELGGALGGAPCFWAVFPLDGLFFELGAPKASRTAAMASESICGGELACAGGIPKSISFLLSAPARQQPKIMFHQLSVGGGSTFMRFFPNLARMRAPWPVASAGHLRGWFRLSHSATVPFASRITNLKRPFAPGHGTVPDHKPWADMVLLRTMARAGSQAPNEGVAPDTARCCPSRAWRHRTSTRHVMLRIAESG
mmetsp:Transcript_72017/g.204398  ORF Transcript_72017/g.204398 Transcript_72017/m.204398 type:complete len:239 (+) Transcript_72017:1176-1892(+)